MLSDRSRLRRLRTSTVVSNWRAILKSVSPRRTRYVSGPEASVATGAAAVRALVADGRAFAVRCGIINDWLARMRERAVRSLASRNSAWVILCRRAIVAIVSPRLTVWNVNWTNSDESMVARRARSVGAVPSGTFSSCSLIGVVVRRSSGLSSRNSSTETLIHSATILRSSAFGTVTRS